MMRRYIVVGQGERPVQLFASAAADRQWLGAQPPVSPPPAP